MSGGDGPSGAWEGCARAFCGGEACPSFSRVYRPGGGKWAREEGIRPVCGKRTGNFFLFGRLWAGGGRPPSAGGPAFRRAGKDRPSVRFVEAPFPPGRALAGLLRCTFARNQRAPPGTKKSPVPGGNGGFLLDLCRTQNSSPQRRKPPQASRPTKMVMTTR